MPGPLAFVCAKLVSGAVSGIVRGCGAIPVHRGSRDIVETMRLSQQALERGENIILCPDVDYASSAAEIGAVYEGFLHLEKAYSPRHGPPPCLCAGGPARAHKARAHGRGYPL